MSPLIESSLTTKVNVSPGSVNKSTVIGIEKEPWLFVIEKLPLDCSISTCSVDDQ